MASIRAKTVTQHIAVSEPDEELLKKSVQGRELSPELATFLKNLIRTKKWTRKVTLPSCHDDLAVALVSTSTLKEGGLEILSELHVFFSGATIIEEWQVVGERERIALLPKEIFRAIDISKVRVAGAQVSVEFSVPAVGAQSSETLVKTFDFSGDKPRMAIAPDPLPEEDSGEPSEG